MTSTTNTRMLTASEPVAYRLVSLSAAFKLSSKIAQESWQVKCDQEPAGFFTRLLIPQVNTKILFPRNHDAGICYCRLLLRDTMLRQDSFRTGVSDTPMCKCGMEHESAEHFLLRCPEHHAARSVMIDDINMILFTSKCKSVPTLSEHLLLAPNWDSNLSKKEDVAIKVTLFKFLSIVQRKLWCNTVYRCPLTTRPLRGPLCGSYTAVLCLLHWSLLGHPYRVVTLRVEAFNRYQQQQQHDKWIRHGWGGPFTRLCGLYPVL